MKSVPSSNCRDPAESRDRRIKCYSLRSREEKEEEPKGRDKHRREGKVKVQRRSSRPAPPLSSSQAFWKEERSPFPVYSTLVTLLLAGLSSLTLFLPSPPFLHFCSIPFSLPSPSQFPISLLDISSFSYLSQISSSTTPTPVDPTLSTMSP